MKNTKKNIKSENFEEIKEQKDLIQFDQVQTQENLNNDDSFLNANQQDFEMTLNLQGIQINGENESQQQSIQQNLVIQDQNQIKKKITIAIPSKQFLQESSQNTTPSTNQLASIALIMQFNMFDPAESPDIRLMEGVSIRDLQYKQKNNVLNTPDSTYILEYFNKQN